VWCTRRWVAVAKRVRFTCKCLSGAWGHMRRRMEEMAPVLESAELDLEYGGWIEVNGPPW
jgi:hypothetical protein